MTSIMGKKVFTLFLCFLGVINNSKTQDFKPSQQAQGYLNDKNVTVDYTTGIFQYKVPLYTINSGNYQLPITLEYTANGVKKEDKPGVIGYNWTLITGGIITRTMRGGVADDDSQFGYAWLADNPNSIPVQNDIERVQGGRDGECDIFTAVFNGQVVHFIIKVSFSPFKITAEPLEQTNVRIECVIQGSNISGWIIIDEFGNKYIYNQKEWTTNVYREDAISSHGIRNKSYVSSWHLNRIEPQNGECIIFNYMARVEDGINDKINISYYEYISKSKFFYGRPMIERTFDFEYYKAEFDSKINQACAYLQNYSFEQQFAHKYEIMVNYVYWVVNPRFKEEGTEIDYNFRIMGQLAEFTKISQFSKEMIQTLNELHDLYDQSTSFNAQMAALCFWDAKDILIQCLNETLSVTHKEVENITTYRIASPLLSSINCLDQQIDIEYHQGKIIKIKSYDLLKNIKSETQLSTGATGLLDHISFMDKNENEIEHVKFDYYMLPANTTLAWDVWGYPRAPSSIEFSVDVEFERRFSLKDITWSKGGNVRIDYESNRVLDRIYPNEEAEEYGSQYGGLFIHPLGDGLFPKQ